MNKQFKSLAIMLCICFIGTTLYSQDETATGRSLLERLNYGITVGSASSGFAENHQTFTHRRNGLFAGAFLEYRLTAFLGISTEVGYIQTGAVNLDPRFLYNEQDILAATNPILEIKQLTAHNILVPLLVNIYPVNNACCVVPYFSLGISASYTTSVQATNLVSHGAIGQQQLFGMQTEDVTSKFRELNTQLVLSPAVKINNSWGTILCGLRYQLGLNTINEYQFDNQRYDFTGNTLLFFLGYSFN